MNLPGCCADSDGSDSEPDRVHGDGKGTAANAPASAAAAQATPATTDAAPSASPAGEAAQRDDWMSESNARPLFNDNAQAAEETNEEKQASRAERMKVRHCIMRSTITIIVHAEGFVMFNIDSHSALASIANRTIGSFRGFLMIMVCPRQQQLWL